MHDPATLAQAIRSADNERNILAIALPTFEGIRHIPGPQRPTPFIEGDRVNRRTKLLLQPVGLIQLSRSRSGTAFGALRGLSLRRSQLNDLEAEVSG